MLKNIREAPASKISWSSSIIETALDNNDLYTIQHYTANIVTEFDERETLNLTAISIDNAKELVRELAGNNLLGLKGRECVKIQIKEF